jgi:hypothetical protein
MNQATKEEIHEALHLCDAPKPNPKAAVLNKVGWRDNEIKFENKKGEEEIDINAKKDLITRVQNNETHVVGNNEVHVVGGNRLTVITHDEDVKVKENRTEKVFKKNIHLVGKDEVHAVGGNRKTFVKKEENVRVEGRRKTTIRQGDLLVVESANQEVNLLFGNAVLHVKGPFCRKVYVPLGEYDLDAMKVVIKGIVQVFIQVGKSTIIVEDSGIKIDGPMVELNCK